MSIATTGGAASSIENKRDLMLFSQRLFMVFSKPEVRTAWGQAFVALGAAVVAARNALNETRENWSAGS